MPRYFSFMKIVDVESYVNGICILVTEKNVKL